MHAILRLIADLLLIASITLILFLLRSGALLRSQTKSIDFAGKSRSYRLHLPSGYDPLKPIPLVIALHGLGDNPKLMELYSGLSVKADQKGFIVVYPAGSRNEQYPKLSWNASFCCGVSWRSESDDLAYLQTLITMLQSEYAIDPTRIFMTGFSNGGMLTYRFASERPGILRAAAVVAGSMGGKVASDVDFISIKKPTKSVPLLVIHGKNDQVVPYDGGTGNDPDASFLSIASSVKIWKDLPHSNVELITTDTGHIWPGLMNIQETLKVRPHFFATDAIVDFFFAQF